MKNLSLSIVVPAYNSSESLAELASRVDSALSEYTKELIIVNDGSRDGTWEKIVELTKIYPWVKGINHMRNYGQHNALVTGIRRAKYEIIITLDDDLQHPPEAIPLLLQGMRPEIDVVYGIPDDPKHKKGKKLASSTVKWVISYGMGNKIASDVSAFRAFRAPVAKALENYQGDYVNLDALLAWATTRFASVITPHDPRKYGVTNYTFKKNLIHAINLVTGFSVRPLQIASMLGFLFVTLGTTIFLYVLWNYFIRGTDVQGFTFLAAALALFSGVQLFCLGIIGAYLARIHVKNQGRPTAIIREETGGE